MKSARQVAKDNGVNYQTLVIWVKKGLVKCSVTVTGRLFFTPEQEKDFIDNAFKSN
jgi:predicted site-specific integrase-resolvase